MKSEERHQLLQNDLSVVTHRTVGFMERHVGLLISVACGILLLVAAGFWWTRSSGSENAAGWTMLDSASNLEEFGSVVDKYKGKPPGQWALLHVSEKTLQTAIPLMFTNREVALSDLKVSRDGFETLLKDGKVPNEIKERALWGLALCLETGCDGDTSKPAEAYEKLVADFPDTIFKSVAEERIQALKKKNAGEFYAWFSKEKPKPPEARPDDIKIDGKRLPPPRHPADMEDEPDDFKSPPDKKAKDEKSESGDKKDAEAPPEDKPDAEKPSEGDKKPAEPEKPADNDKPSDKEPK